MKAYGRIWLLVAVLLGSLGLVEALLDVSSLAAWTAAGAAGSMTILVHLARLARLEVKASATAVVLVGLVGAVIGAATTGLGAVAGGGRAVAVVAIVACCHPRLVGVLRTAVQRTRRWLRPDGTSGPAALPLSGRATDRPSSPIVLPAVVQPSSETPDPPTAQRWPEAAAVPLLSTAELCWGWRTSFTALARTSARTDLQRFLVLVAVRQRYLDEIARRDPAGFVRWLQAGARPAGDPSRYLRSSADEARPSSAEGDGGG